MRPLNYLPSKPIWNALERPPDGIATLPDHALAKFSNGFNWDVILAVLVVVTGFGILLFGAALWGVVSILRVCNVVAYYTAGEKRDLIALVPGGVRGFTVNVWSRWFHGRVKPANFQGMWVMNAFVVAGIMSVPIIPGVLLVLREQGTELLLVGVVSLILAGVVVLAIYFDSHYSLMTALAVLLVAVPRVHRGLLVKALAVYLVLKATAYGLTALSVLPLLRLDDGLVTFMVAPMALAVYVALHETAALLVGRRLLRLDVEVAG